jgi:hypothetical protein
MGNEAEDGDGDGVDGEKVRIGTEGYIDMINKEDEVGWDGD